MIISHNLRAMNVNRMYNINTNTMASHTEKLSSGYRINRAADDAAGLSISEKMRRQIRGLNQASNNLLEGISYVQVADGALNEVHDMLQRINELAVKSANGTNTAEDRTYIDAEVQNLKTEINRVFSTTTFNDRKIWDENLGVQTKIGEESRQAVTMTSSHYRATINNENCDVLACGDYTINADTSGLYVSWIGYDGNNYQTETIDWDTLKAQNYSFNIANYFGTNDGSNPLYTSIGNPKINCVISCKVEESATVDDMIASLNGVTLSNSLNSGTYVRYDGIEGTDWGVTTSDFRISAILPYNAAYASDLNFNSRDEDVMKPIDSNGNVVTVGSGTGNVTSIPDAILANDLAAARTSTDTWEISFYLEGIGKVTAISNSISYSPIKNGSPDYGAAEYTYGAGTLGSAMITLTKGQGSVGLLSPENGGACSEGGIIVIGFKLTSENSFSYGDQTSNDVGSLALYLNVYNTDTEQDVLDRISSALSSDTVIDYCKKDGYAQWGYIYPPTANTHIIDVPVYQTNCGLNIQAGTEAGNYIQLTYEALNNTYLGINNCDVLTEDACGTTIDAVKNAINLLSEQRALFGSYQNRMEHTYNNLQNVEENTQHAESRIRDTDMASKMVEYANHNILLQAGQAMLSQANRSNERVLQLLS